MLVYLALRADVIFVFMLVRVGVQRVVIVIGYFGEMFMAIIVKKLCLLYNNPKCRLGRPVQ